MNKLVKASIAGAAGIALLLGGAGTFALWNDSVGSVSASINTGDLDIELDGTAAWTDASATTTGNVTTFDPATQKIVPGDVVKYTQKVRVNTVGKNIKAQLSYTAGSIVIPTLVQPNVTVGLTAANVTGGTVVAVSGTPNTYTVTPTAQGTPVVFDVVITVTFNSLTANQTNTNVTDAVKLTNAAFTLTQVRP